jgi:hypothetical protein
MISSCIARAANFKLLGNAITTQKQLNLVRLNSTLKRSLEANRSSRFFSTTSIIHMAKMASESSKAVNYGHFEPLQSFNVKYAPVQVAKYRSKRTGLTVVIGNHKSPITNGHFVVASEIFDDTGRPHTLEHLVFLGSKSYPYKGVLDQLANRAGSNGTNAWTDTDRE